MQAVLGPDVGRRLGAPVQMAAAVAVDGEELSLDGEEPSPDRRRTTRNDDACAQSKTVLQDQAGSPPSSIFASSISASSIICGLAPLASARLRSWSAGRSRSSARSSSSSAAHLVSHCEQARHTEHQTRQQIPGNNVIATCLTIYE